MSETRRLRLRPLVSLLSAWGFLLLLVTGLVLYVEPHGRVAFWTEWTFLGLGKEQWDGVHIVSGWLFIVAGLLHVWLNWKPLLRHLGRGAQVGWRLRWELLLSLAIGLVVALGGLLHLPPVGWLLDINDAAKSAWVRQPADKPPFGHAEMVSLSKLCDQMHFDLDEATAALQGRGIAVSSSSQTIKEIAAANELSPSAVYQVIQSTAPASECTGQGQGKGKGRGNGG